MEGTQGSPLERVQPEGWPRPRGYSNGYRVPAGHDLVVTAGQIGWDAQERFPDDAFVPQFEQALRNVVAVVEAAGGRAEHLVRLTMFCVDVEEYLGDLEAVGAAYRAVLGKHYPCMSLVQVSRLVEPKARVEIEATAAVPARAGG